MLKKILNHLWLIMPAVAVILIAVLLAVVLPARMNAEKVASEKGSFVGKAVGSCVGSFNGFTEGLAKGDEAGEKRGLSAEDTTVNMIGKEVHDIGKLEVLNLSIKRSEVFSTDNGKNNTLYMREGNASYSVDLKKAKIFDNGNQIVIEIPYPVLDEVKYGEAEEIAHYSVNPVVGSTENGIDAYLNSQNEIKKKIEEELAADTEIYEQAKKAALNQVGSLFEKLSIENKIVTVEFAEGIADGAK